MRKPFIVTALVASALLTSCGGAGGPTATRQNSNATANNAQSSIQHGTSPTTPGVVSSHGGSAADGASGAGASSATPSVPTPELDAKIEKAAAKATAAGAGAADKKAAAAAYFERADFYREQGVPTLYKFALRDYRVGLRYDPNNSEARGKMDEIVRIYQSMGRPVPDLGNEQ
jgi:hypothetical protein